MRTTLTHRERWRRTLHGEPVDHVPDEEFGYWSETYSTWHRQGLPEEVGDEGGAQRFFGFAPRGGVPVHLGLLPSFEARVLEDSDRHRIVVDGEGVKSIIHKDGRSSIPHYLEFPLQTRDDWEAFKERLDPHDPRRYPPADRWQAWKQQVGGRDYPLGIGCGSLFGWLRNWMGFEGVSLACALQPDWVEEMMEYLADFILTVIRRAVEEVELDYGAFWEDMCFNKGSIISPAMFRRWMTPRYRRITDFLRDHGVDLVYVDSDGNIMELIPLWQAGGVNVMFPLEVRGGSDPVKVRERYGRQVCMMGGVDKTRLIAGQAAILEELDRLAPLVEEGRYIPHVDHRCPPDVRYSNYLFYLEAKRRRFGIPDPPHWEEAKATARQEAAGGGS